MYHRLFFNVQVIAVESANYTYTSGKDCWSDAFCMSMLMILINETADPVNTNVQQSRHRTSAA